MNASPVSAQAPALLDAFPSPGPLLNSILRQADAHYAREEWSAAREVLSLAAAVAPDDPQITGALGSLHFRLKDHAQACAAFTAAVRQCPDNPDLHAQLAMVHIELKQWAEAKAALQRSLSLRPNHPTARQMLGDLDFAAKRYADAAEAYCAALESNPDGVSLLLHLGKCQYELRDLASARWCFERVIALEPANAIASEALQLLAASGSTNSRATAAERDGGGPTAAGDFAPGSADRQGTMEAKPDGRAPQSKVLPLGNFRPVFAEPKLTLGERTIAEAFHDLYYSKLDCGRGLHTIVLSWMGYEMFKCPLDLWIYQELIVHQKPDVIIETGTYKGGSALFLASVCDCIGHGEVVTIDLDASHQAIRPPHPRITYLQGSSTAPDVLAKTNRLVAGRTNVLVILDSDHRYEHVIAELRAYREFVPVDGYLIVEDTNINGHPTYKDFGAGPWEAVEEFLSEDHRFVADRTCERFILTMNPRGFLRRTRT